jgi:hypothetical protein
MTRRHRAVESTSEGGVVFEFEKNLTVGPLARGFVGFVGARFFRVFIASFTKKEFEREESSC